MTTFAFGGLHQGRRYGCRYTLPRALFEMVVYD